MTNPRTYIDDIEILTTGQLANYESIPSLAQSVSHITSVISQLKNRNEDICNNNTSEREEGPLDVMSSNPSGASKSYQLRRPGYIALTQLMISSENNIEECTSSLKENAFYLSSNENLSINLNASIIDSTQMP
jgi:hypothetical protein